MSEFTQNNLLRVDILTDYTIGLIDGKSGTDLLNEFKILENDFLPQDLIQVFDNLFNKKLDIEKIKPASNKLFNILFKKLSKHNIYNYPKDSILYFLVQDNIGVNRHLTNTKKNIKLINQHVNKGILVSLIDDFLELEKFTVHYTILENILFSEIEKKWKNHQCLKLMWSFHDDIRKNIKKTLRILNSEQFDLQLFNQISSKIYFNINTIIFREENVLYPVIFETFEKNIFQRMQSQLQDFNFLYVKTKSINITPKETIKSKNFIKFRTGELSLEQIELVFNHLPVDITFVDENDKVQYFSSPNDRIFPRTTGIIGRKVQNCHPHESVEIVNNIIDSFKNGKKNDATFWIKMGQKFVLIQYLAVRDNSNNYKGILEVSQEISEIQNLKGERRLLDW